MNTRPGMILVSLAVVIVAILGGPVASANCGKVDKPRAGAFLGQNPSGQSESVGADPIVGFWRVKLLSEGNTGIPDGAVLDDAYVQWHSDGTEIMNSSRAPETGSFCLGVWTRTKPFHYKLNHYAIAWANGALLGPASIREQVTLNQDGSSFTGTFTIDQYDEKGNLLAHLTGQIEAKRITVDTPVTDVL
jgi:hypothetical protein